MSRPRRRYIAIGVPVLLIALAATACLTQTLSAPRIRVENVWSRPAVGAGPAAQSHMSGMGSGSTSEAAGGPGVVYLDLINEGGAPDRLIKVEADVASSAELHESTVKDGIAQMKPVAGGIEVPANGKTQLKPGGYHVMLMGLKRDLKLDDKFPVTLQFEKSSVVRTQSTVRQ